ncbi:hypothetical protein GCM10010387_04670 [Streptomyces inusitatus]|uniref:Uncharacterized protein n=1 Tax=Streptomyces inusitatus TaxID=68221 RepID=A0A918UJT7_9ACTN|nr:hypothetical protein GCM10010387_04670 [Streptomyces inusitatus]
MLLRHLPRDSAIARELNGEAAEWSPTDYLLAQVIDQLAESNWMFATVNRDEDSDPLDFPKPVTRPGQKPSPAPEPAPEPEPVPEPDTPPGTSPGTGDPGDPGDPGTGADVPSPAQLAAFFS